MNWNKKINIRPITEADKGTDKSAALTSKKLAAYLLKELHSYNTGGVCEIALIIKEMKNVKTQCEANSALERLYDWADESRVWLGI